MNEQIKSFFQKYKVRIIVVGILLVVYAGSCAGCYICGRNKRISGLESNTAAEQLADSIERGNYLEQQLAERDAELARVYGQLESVGSRVDDCIGIVRQLDKSNRDIIESSGNIEATSLNIAKLARELSLRVDNYENGFNQINAGLAGCKDSLKE